MASRVEQFESLVAQQPQNALFRFSLAQSLVSAGRATAAIPHYQFCIASKDDWMMPRILLGKLLLELGRDAEATPLLTDALRLAVAQAHEEPERELRALLAGL